MADATKPWVYTDGREQNSVYREDVQNFRKKGLDEERAHRIADLFYDMEVHKELSVDDDPVYQELLQSAQNCWEEFKEEYDTPQDLAEERYKDIVLSEAAEISDPDGYKSPLVPADVTLIEPYKPERAAGGRRRYGFERDMSGNQRHIR